MDNWTLLLILFNGGSVICNLIILIAMRKYAEMLNKFIEMNSDNK